MTSTSHLSRPLVVHKVVSLYRLKLAPGSYCQSALFDSHATRLLGLDITQVDRVQIGLFFDPLGRHQVRLEALAKVGHAHNAVGDGEDDEKDRNNGKGCE